MIFKEHQTSQMWTFDLKVDLFDSPLTSKWTFSSHPDIPQTQIFTNFDFFSVKKVKFLFLLIWVRASVPPPDYGP